MPATRILASWIGHADLLAMAEELPESQKAKVLHELRASKAALRKHGPIRTLLHNEAFDEVHLLSNYSGNLNRHFSKWVGGDPEIHEAHVEDPTDYSQIFRETDRVLSEVIGGRGPSEAEFCVHLSPGTPAMAAIWVLLGKSRYPATFYQTHSGKAWKTEIPFDLVVDFVPELLREPDSSLQHLAARTPQQVAGFQEIIGSSKAIRLAVGRAAKAAVRDVPVLILGESGTGKEMFARAIHAASHRADKPFLAINCAAIPRGLLESELFGHAKNAFTGATSAREGAFQLADGGTLFLDEVGECDPDMQAKLLRVLQPPPGEPPCSRVFRRVGEFRDQTSNVRVVAATNRDLIDEIRQNAFREDLFYRLAVITIKLPALRERKTDINPIAEALLQQINRDFREQEPGYRDKSISAGAKEFVETYGWPGNVRQLYNALVQAAVMAEGDVVRSGDLAATITDLPANGLPEVLDHPLGDGFSLQGVLEDVQRYYLQRAMEEAGGVKTRAARLLGIENYQTLDAQLKRLGVKAARRRPSRN